MASLVCGRQRRSPPRDSYSTTSHGFTMLSKIVLAVCILVTVAAALPQPGVGGWPGAVGVSPWIPPWVAAAPWYPQWSPCTAAGSSCLDCNTRLVCTKIGALQRSCTDPELPHCNLGKCSATPSDECAAADTTDEA